jgi:hypothetical protein
VLPSPRAVVALVAHALVAHALVTLVALTLGVAGCAPTLADAERLAATGRAVDAARAFDRIAASSPTGSAAKVRALTRSAELAIARGDERAARERLEAAIAPELPGESEPALYLLARLLERTDRPRALSLYYRAAASAERHRGRGSPYPEATGRILQLSMEPGSPR